MRPSLVILPAPSLDQHLSFPQGLKHLPVEQLIPEFSVKTLRIAILPRTARLDLQGTGSQSLEPVLRLPGNKLRPIVGTKRLRHAPFHEYANSCTKVIPLALFRSRMGYIMDKPGMVLNRASTGGAKTKPGGGRSGELSAPGLYGSWGRIYCVRSLDARAGLGGRGLF